MARRAEATKQFARLGGKSHDSPLTTTYDIQGVARFPGASQALPQRPRAMSIRHLVGFRGILRNSEK